jgi:GH43 family beta-xylosidase
MIMLGTQSYTKKPDGSQHTLGYLVALWSEIVSDPLVHVGRDGRTRRLGAR